MDYFLEQIGFDNNQRLVVLTRPYLLQGLQEEPLVVRIGRYDDLRISLRKLILTKVPFWVTICCIIKFVSTFQEEGMSALHLAKKFWIICFMTILLCCHGFGLLIRAVTYFIPNLIFHKKLQDYLEIIFKMFVIVWCISWV